MDSLSAAQGVNQILSKLQDEELFGLAATVTQGLLRNKLETRAGAVEAILKYSSDFQSILRRKVVTRDILFDYLHESGIPVSLPVTKNELIDTICQYLNLRHTTTFASSTSDTSINRSYQPDVRPLQRAQTQANTYETNVGYPFKGEVQRREQTQPEINTMALKFAEWFYMMMNSNEPIGVEHFWKDARLKLHLVSPSQSVDQAANNNVEEIVHMLYKTKCEHNLYFNPNFLSDGVQGRMDPHGLVVVLACGTLHANNVCVGVFEQVFMLARDPFCDNNWKIKNTELNLTSKGNVSNPPSLRDSSLTSDLLALPTS